MAYASADSSARSSDFTPESPPESSSPSAPSTSGEAPIYDPECAAPSERLDAFADFAAIVTQLRRDCPWDREQTHTSVKHLLIEEAYEVVDAIEACDWDELKRELGDVFLHVLFHSRIAEEAGRFTLQDVMEAETNKLIRRHPHVFGPEANSDLDSDLDSETVLANWEQIKQQEREANTAPDDATDNARKHANNDGASDDVSDPDRDVPSVLDGVPSHLPSLLRALRVQEKAAGVGFDFPDPAQTWAKVEEEIREFADTLGIPPNASASPEPTASSPTRVTNERVTKERVTNERVTNERQEDELGDVLFALINVARRADLNPENALRRTTNRFIQRVQYIEARLAERGQRLADVDLQTADALWEEAKQTASEAARETKREAAREATSPTEQSPTEQESAI